jgi:hypothetical protein
MKKLIFFMLLFVGACALGSLTATLLPATAAADAMCTGYDDHLCGSQTCEFDDAYAMTCCRKAACSGSPSGRYAVYSIYTCPGPTVCYVQSGCWAGTWCH